jgi:hypothetical protein
MCKKPSLKSKKQDTTHHCDCPLKNGSCEDILSCHNSNILLNIYILQLYCLRSFEHWDRDCESHSKHGCVVRLHCVCVVLCR